MRIRIESPDQADIIELIAELDAYQDSLYPAESRYALDLASLKKSNVRFVVARDQADRAVGCGAIVLYNGFAELKRMYVRQHSRGKGVAQAILSSLEQAAADAGYTHFKLETGPAQPDALAFYAKSGYTPCARYADYRDDPNSVYLHKLNSGAA